MTLETRPAGRPGTPWIAAALAVIAIGAGFRILEFLANRPFWTDEANLALNVGARSFTQLLHPLDYDQASAPLFLWTAKLATVLGGVNEPALRAVALLAGVALLAVLWDVTRKLAGVAAGLVATILAAVSVRMVYFSGEFKPYGADALVTVVVCGLVWAVLRAPESAAAWRRLAIGGAVAVAASLPAPFVLLGAGAALLADRRIRASALGRRRIGLTGAGWLAAWGMLYLLVYRHTLGNPYFEQYWSATFLDPSAPDFRVRLYRAATSLIDALPPPMDAMPPVILLILLAGGALALFRFAGLPAAIQAVVPFAAAFGASVAGRYPIEDRLLLFLAPLTFLLMATGVTAPFRNRSPRLAAVTGIALAGVAFVAAMPGLLRNARSPVVQEDARESIREVHRVAGSEPVYLMATGVALWAYYSTDWREPDRARLEWIARIASSPAGEAFNAAPRAGPVEPQEGMSLVRPYAGRQEIFGIRSGMQYLARRGRVRAAPDSGWADHEAARIRTAVTEYGWVMAAHGHETELAELGAALGRAGAGVVRVKAAHRAEAWRLRFPPGAAPR
jgi:hypothetical protein